MNREVVVTGLGVISSIGIGWRNFWESLLAGRSGISEITSFDTARYETHKGGEVRGFLPQEHDFTYNHRRYNRTSQFAIIAAKMALQDAGLDTEDLTFLRAGVAIGTTMAEAQAIERIDSIWVESGEASIPPRLFIQYPSNMISAYVGKELGAIGPNLAIATACAAGNYAIAYGYDLISLGKADLMVVGGADALSRIAFMGFNRLLAVAPDRCQPFDKNRKGMMVGEGSGILVLERRDHALARGAVPYASILGYGLACDASHMTIPDKDGVSRVMASAIRDAGLDCEDIDYISAHGTGTYANDKTEAAAIRTVFGEKTDKIPVSATKSMLGHTMGAASAIEAIACVLAVTTDSIPPTINYETPDPECDIDCVPNLARKHRVSVALNNSFAFGGNNACIAFGK